MHLIVRENAYIEKDELVKSIISEYSFNDEVLVDFIMSIIDNNREAMHMLYSALAKEIIKKD